MSDTDITKLIEQLSHENSKIRIAAIKALAHFEGTEEVHAALVNLLHDNSIAVARSAVLALGQIGDCDTVDMLVPLLNHNELWIQKATIQALGDLGCQEIVPALVNLLGQGDLDALAREALVSLKVDPDFF